MTESIRDNVTPGDKWEFDKDVADSFEDMLRRSIPQYDVMREACFQLACRYRQTRTDIIDVGCSRGEAIAALLDKYGVGNRFIGLEISAPMLSAARERFDGMIRTSVVDIRQCDLRKEFVSAKASVIMCVLTLQFTPIEYRQRILRNMYQSLIPGGALIIVEKVLGNDADIDEVMTSAYYDMKRKNGYTEDQIQRKKLSLEGVLVPVTAHWNEELLRTAGFSIVDCFWRWMNFAGWVAVR